ncbi:MAG: 2Fe-2S iron-sulfur cluster-binding protein [bacterium]
MPKVTFLPQNETVQAREGTILLDVALDNNIRIHHNCGGNMACATCQVRIEQGFETLPPMTEEEDEMLLDAENRQSTSRLACQTIVNGDLVVRIPPSELDENDDQLV